MSDTSRLTAALADQYSIEREVGAGGMATVYLAEDLKHHRKVAVKVLRSDLAAVLGSRRFLKEIEIAARLQHPHILPLYDSGEADGFLYYVMPFVDGESLRDKLAREGELPIAETVRILRDVVDALAKAHSQGVVHRDIKPDNIMLSDRHALVADFGVAKAVSEATGLEQLTTAGVALGTPAYMAPEQAAADPHIDHRADIYALGVVAYEMLTGQPPFTGATPQAVLSAHVTQEPDTVTKHRPSVPPALAEFVMTCLEKKAADRWQDTAELISKLEAMSAPSGGTAPVRLTIAQASIAMVSEHKIGTGVAVTAVVAFVALLLFVFGVGSYQVIASAKSIAVVPPSPSSADSALSRLGRDLAVLLSANLDGVGDIDVVDAASVLAQIDDPNARLTLEEAANIASTVGATSVIHGSIVRIADEVRLDLGLYETEGLSEIARASVTASPDQLAALTDSATWAMLASIWRSGDAPTPNVGAITTRSMAALRAFLEGEEAITNNSWASARDHFQRAIEADSSFWLAYWRRVQALTWNGRDVPDDLWLVVTENRFSLPERDRLLIEARMPELHPGERARIAALEQAVRRYPTYWPALMAYGDRIIHNGPSIGIAVSEGVFPIRQVARLNPRFQPAWQHLIFVGLVERDFDLMSMAADSLSNLGGLQTMVGSVRVLAALASGVDLDELATDSTVREIGFLGGALWTGDWAALSHFQQRAVALGITEPNASLQAISLAARGAWDSAWTVVQQLRRAGTPETYEFAYPIAAAGAWAGGLDPSTLDDFRSSLRALELADSVTADLTWLDGLMAATRDDADGVRAARVALQRMVVPTAPAMDSALLAFEMFAEGNRFGAGRLLADLEWARAAARSSEYEHPFLAPINRLAAAEWLSLEGDHDDAARLLLLRRQFTVTRAAYGTWVLGALFVIQEARVADRSGRFEEATEYYSEFLRRYDLPVAAHQHLVDEATAALERLTGEGN